MQDSLSGVPDSCACFALSAALHCLLCFSPRIGFKNICFDNLKSIILGFPEGFEHLGPQIRIPREKTGYTTDWKRLETTQSGQQITKVGIEKVLVLT